MVRVLHQAEQAKLITHQELQWEELDRAQEQMEKQLLYSM